MSETHDLFNVGILIFGILFDLEYHWWLFWRYVIFFALYMFLAIIAVKCDVFFSSFLID